MNSKSSPRGVPRRVETSGKLAIATVVARVTFLNAWPRQHPVTQKAGSPTPGYRYCSWASGFRPAAETLRPHTRGFTYKEIARELFISPKTVESHVSAVLRKLQLLTRHH